MRSAAFSMLLVSAGWLAGCGSSPGPGDPRDLGPSDRFIADRDATDGDRDGDGTPDELDGCPDDSSKVEPGECGCGVPEGTCPIEHIGTTEAYDPDGQEVVIERPSASAEGDLLVLILHRTDDDLPLFVDGWTRVAECYKGDNAHDCGTEATCTTWHDDPAYCAAFDGSGDGHDLAQAVFYRVVGVGEPTAYSFDLNLDTTGAPGWAILTALRNAATTDPVRDWAGVGCDRDLNSVFPSVDGVAGDMVLLSQSFDDPTASESFTAPPGTELLGYVSMSDEAGFLFGGILGATGATGPMETGGPGGPGCKDALISLTVIPR